jgi:hypothetical protein
VHDEAAIDADRLAGHVAGLAGGEEADHVRHVLRPLEPAQGNGGEPPTSDTMQNTVVHTYPMVSQFWTYKPEEFLRAPAYDRNYPPVTP